MTNTNALQLSSSSLLWKQLMDNSIFDDCYPQKLNASFHYLCADNADSTSFSLKDLIQKGSYIFTYLSIDVDKDSSFAIMDIFRAFDRSGRGSVFLEEFVLGVLERLNSIKKDTALLESIAEDLLSIESRCTELAALLEKERSNNSSKFSKYNRNLKSLSNIIRSYIRSSKSTQYLSAMDVPSLVRAFELAIIHAVAEVQVYFHIPDGRMAGALADLIVQRDQLKVGQNLKMIWNMTSPSIPPSRVTSGSAVEGVGGSAASMGVEDSRSGLMMTRTEASWLKESPEDLLSNILSNAGGDNNRMKQLRFDGEGNRYSQQEMVDFLKTVLPTEAMQMLSSGFVEDNVQLHLLQDTFTCINNFFQLQHPNTLLLSSEEQPAADERGNGYKNSEERDRGTVAVPTKRKADISRKLQEYREALGLSQKPRDSERDSSSEEGTVLVAVITEDLLRTQEQLHRTQQRLQLMELIQSDLMAEHFRQQEQEKEKEKARLNVMASMFHHQQQQQQASSSHTHTRSSVSMTVPESAEDNNSHSSAGRAISERINNHNPRFHRTPNHDPINGVEPHGLEDGDVGYSTDDEGTITLHREETVTYEEILKEFSALETCLAERSRVDYALGLLLDRPIAILTDDEHTFSSSSEAATSSSPSAQSILDSSQQLLERVQEEMRIFLEQAGKRDDLVLELKNKEDLLTEYRTKIEQIDIERSEWISMNAELQILREKLQKYQKEEQSSRILEQKNLELQKKVHSLEEQLLSFQEIDRKYSTEKAGAVGGLNENQNFPSRNASSTEKKREKDRLSSATSHASDEEVEKLRDSLQQLSTAHSDLSQQNEQYQKEIQRLKTTINLSEQRVKSILQDSMVLHQSIQSLEEENMNAKATITKLLREVEDMKNLRSYKEESERKLFEYQKQMTKFEVEIAESRENNVIINKYHNDLITAERTIEALEQKLAEYAVELEKGKIATNQLENFREAMKGKLQEIRDLSLYIHQLENQLKDVPYLNTRYQELSSELSDCKVKVDKIPGLLAEIARLRGSSRASIKALMEQDKLISTMKSRLKLLEKDNALLKHENQSLLDLEMKVKEANQEIKRLMNIITELQGHHHGLGGGSSGVGGGNSMAQKAMTIMMLNKFSGSAHGSVEGDEAASPLKAGSNTSSSANPKKATRKFTQGSIAMQTASSPFSRGAGNVSSSSSQNVSSALANNVSTGDEAEGERESRLSDFPSPKLSLPEDL